MHVSEQPKLPEGWHGTSVLLSAQGGRGLPHTEGFGHVLAEQGAYTALPREFKGSGALPTHLRLLTEPLEKGSPSCTAFQSRTFTAVSYFLGLRVFPHQPHKLQMEFKDLLIPHHNLVSPLPFHLPFASCLRKQHPQAGQGLAGPGRGGCHI